VQEFPDDWQLAGPVIQQYKQIGNAVPISLGRAIGRLLIAVDEGLELPIPNGFKFSRYRNTSEKHFLPKANTQKSLF
jgi:DNA (cytosine-5)-methyltransferase 1